MKNKKLKLKGQEQLRKKMPSSVKGKRTPGIRRGKHSPAILSGEGSKIKCKREKLHDVCD